MIALHSMPGSLQVEPSRVLFTFASGRLDYDCVACEAQCCRGKGYELTGRELEQQLLLRPAIRFFVEPQTRSRYSAMNCAPGCFFLDEQGLCGVHKSLGWLAKPETCRLFPFNDLAMVGDYLIVSPHRGLCPLTVAPAQAESRRSDHAVLLGTMTELGIHRPVSRSLVLAGDTDGAVALERRVRDSAEEYLHAADYECFAELQLALTEEAVCQGGRLIGRAQAYSEMLTALLGVGERDLTESTEDRRLCVALTPVVRSRLVFRPLNPSAVQPTPPPLQLVPLFMVALYLLVRQARLAGMNALTYQTVMGLFDRHRPLLTFLAYLDSHVVARPGAAISLAAFGTDDDHTRYLAIARELVAGGRSGRTRRLNEVLKDNMKGSAFDRLVFLRQIAERLVDSVVLAFEAHKYTTRTIRSRVHQWVLAHVDPPVIAAAARKKLKTLADRPSS